MDHLLLLSTHSGTIRDEGAFINDVKYPYNFVKSRLVGLYLRFLHFATFLKILTWFYMQSRNTAIEKNANRWLKIRYYSPFKHECFAVHCNLKENTLIRYGGYVISTMVS